MFIMFVYTDMQHNSTDMRLIKNSYRTLDLEPAAFCMSITIQKIGDGENK